MQRSRKAQEGKAMLAYQDCVGLCDLNIDEVAAIAEHEHQNPIIAAAFGRYLLCHNGEPMIRKMIMDDIEQAERKQDYAHAEVLRKTLAHFIACHPEHKQV